MSSYHYHHCQNLTKVLKQEHCYCISNESSKAKMPQAIGRISRLFRNDSALPYMTTAQSEGVDLKEKGGGAPNTGAGRIVLCGKYACFTININIEEVWLL